jgi:hypothetical protein
MIPAAVPGGGVGGGQQRVEFGGVEEADDCGGGPFGLDGQDPGDQVGVFRCAQAGVAEQGVDRGQPVVAGGDGVPARRFQVVQELADGDGVQVGQVELGGEFPGPLVDVGDQ